jgi:UDP-N-acetylmuramoylalanine--D-glutamate ligase
VSSYQLDLSPTFSPDIAILINISPDHIDRHGSMENYVAAKKHVFNNTRGTQTAIVGIDDAYSARIFEELKTEDGRHLVPVSVMQKSDGVYVADGILHDAQRKLSFDISGLPNLLGKHNHQNAAMAYAATIALGLRPEQIFAALKTFPGLIYRQQLIAEIKGVRFVNDSKATNADSTSKALPNYDNIYWIVGGRSKEGGLNGLEEFMPNVRKAFLIGEAQDDFSAWLDGKAQYIKCGTLDQAVTAAYEEAQKDKISGAVVLLSPACASFDQFKSFEERGEMFTALVQKIKNENARLSA